MELTKSEVRQIQCFVDAVTTACRNLGIKSRGYLPIGGRYPNEILIKCKICGRHFGALVYNPEDAWAVSVHVVEEVRGHEKHGKYYYREAAYQHMFFINGRIEDQRECLGWGVQGIDGFDLRMVGFDEYLAEYITNYSSEYDNTGGKPFGSVIKALEYYSAWETKEHRFKRIKREREELKSRSDQR